MRGFVRLGSTMLILSFLLYLLGAAVVLGAFAAGMSEPYLSMSEFHATWRKASFFSLPIAAIIAFVFVGFHLVFSDPRAPRIVDQRRTLHRASLISASAIAVSSPLWGYFMAHHCQVKLTGSPMPAWYEYLSSPIPPAAITLAGVAASVCFAERWMRALFPYREPASDPREGV